MPNFDPTIESIIQQVSGPVPQTTTYFSTLDSKYTYSFLNLDRVRAYHCNFNKVSVDMTGT